MFLSLLYFDIIFHLFLTFTLIALIALFVGENFIQSRLGVKMENNPVRNLQLDHNLRVIQPQQVEPVVYRSNQSIITGYGSSQLATIESVSSSQSTLASYLPRSGISSLNDVPSCHIHQVYEINDGEQHFRMCL